jgi:hypothetical protein
MPKPIPLRRALRVEGPDVVVDDPGRFLVDFFVEGLAAEEGKVGLSVEGPVEADAVAGLDLGGGGFDDVGGEAVEGAELVVFAVAALLTVQSGAVSCGDEGVAYRPQAL